MTQMVVIESPMAGRPGAWCPWFLRPIVGWLLGQRNRIYALACVRDSVLVRGESPYASHVLFAEALTDRSPMERKLGMEIGFQWGALAEVRAVYCDYGISPGMQEGIARRTSGQRLEYRYLNPIRAAQHRCPRCGQGLPPNRDKQPPHCVPLVRSV